MCTLTPFLHLSTDAIVFVFGFSSFAKGFGRQVRCLRLFECLQFVYGVAEAHAHDVDEQVDGVAAGSRLWAKMKKRKGGTCRGASSRIKSACPAVAIRSEYGTICDRTAGNNNELAVNLKPSIHGVLPEELEAFCKEQGQPAFRAKQIWDWLYGKKVSSFDEMRNLPAAFREWLAGTFIFHPLEKIETGGAAGETQKLLFRLGDHELIETVIIPAPQRGTNTVCLSSQVGCVYGCAFCASGQNGVIRNLTAGEIVGQVLAAARELGQRPDNLVFMGIGEPFDNYDNVMRSIRILNHAEGLKIGARRITVSTCGVVPGIQRFAEEGLQVELSVSLHAPDSEVRSALMPVNETWPFEELLDACKQYTAATNRIITFEYTLIKGVNDSPQQARGLVRLLKTFPCRVNLIPLSPVEEFDGERPDDATVRMFFQILEKAGINTTLRDSKGSALKAACGQLRSHHAGRK